MRPAVFFDRDGTLNRDTGFPHRPDQLEMIPGAAETVAAFTRAGWRAFIVTNQSGIARGYFTEADFAAFNAALLARLAAAGGRIDAVFHCPHHPDITGPCRCRKPRPGMIEAAFARHEIDRSRSLLIGDAPRDVAAAEAAGIPGHLFPGGDLLEFCRSRDLLP